eukprot:gene20189-22165_t
MNEKRHNRTIIESPKPDSALLGSPASTGNKTESYLDGGNFQRFQPLPSIKDPTTAVAIANQCERENGCMFSVEEEVSRSTSCETIIPDSGTRRINNLSRAKQHREGEQSSSPRYKWLQTAHDLLPPPSAKEILSMRLAPDEEHSPRRGSSNGSFSNNTSPRLADYVKAPKGNSKNYTKKQQGEFDLKSLGRQMKAESGRPNFMVRNSRCVRQLPPLELEPKTVVMPPRPTCPSPTNPPSTPIDSPYDV